MSDARPQGGPAPGPDADGTGARPASPAAAVRLMAFDVDGTLTDGGILIGPNGESHKRFSVRDGFGLVLLQQAGIRVALVTGRSSAIVAQRARELRIDTVLQGVADKAAAMRELCSDMGVEPSQAGFMGDDWPDLPAMLAVGFAATVPDAAPEVRRVAHWTATLPAGGGAVRELAEHLLRVQGRFRDALGRFDGRLS